MQAFIREVRRYYPFFPAVPAKVRQSFRWDAHEFPVGRLVLLDLHGINRGPRLWQDPASF